MRRSSQVLKLKTTSSRSRRAMRTIPTKRTLSALSLAILLRSATHSTGRLLRYLTMEILYLKAISPQFVATVLSPTMIQTRSEGVDSGTIEVKTWTFMPEGATVRTEVLRDNQLYPVVSEQVMARVDRNNRDRSLVLGWHK